MIKFINKNVRQSEYRLQAREYKIVVQAILHNDSNFIIRKNSLE